MYPTRVVAVRTVRYLGPDLRVEGHLISGQWDERLEQALLRGRSRERGLCSVSDFCAVPGSAFQQLPSNGNHGAFVSKAKHMHASSLPGSWS